MITDFLTEIRKGDFQISEHLDIDTHFSWCKFCVNCAIYCYSFYLRLGYKVIVFNLVSRCLQKRERYYWLTKLFDITHLIRALGPCTCTMSPSSYVIWINQPANLCLHCDHSAIPSCNLYMAMTFPQAPVHVLYMLRIYVPISHSM